MKHYCEVADCEEPAARGTLCAAHLKRQQRGQSLATPIAERLSPEERVLDAGSAFLEADEPEDYERCRGAFLRACETWLKSRGWTPPGRARQPSSVRRPRRRMTWMQLELPMPRPQAGRG